MVPLFPVRFKDSQSSTLEGDPYLLHENGTLEIYVAQALNSGKYICVARNTLGIAENHVYLEVKGEIPHYSLSQFNSIQGALLAWETWVNIAKASVVSNIQSEINNKNEQ